MEINEIIQCVLRFYPDTQALYLFGSYGTEDERPESDVDLALLLPRETAKAAKGLVLGDCWRALIRDMERSLDLINLRRVDTVFQHEIVQTGRVLYCASEYEKDVFEMEVMGRYQKLNEERTEIVADILRTGRVLAS